MEKVHGGWLKKGYWGFVQGENFLAHFLLLFVRVYWGGLLVVTGLGKWTNIQHVSGFFATLDLPFPLFAAYLVGALEFIGGISLFIGLFSRIFAFILSVFFFCVYAIAHQAAIVNFFTAPATFIKEEPFFFLFASLIVLCFGPGCFSIDYWIEKKSFGRAL